MENAPFMLGNAFKIMDDVIVGSYVPIKVAQQANPMINPTYQA